MKHHPFLRLAREAVLFGLLAAVPVTAFAFVGASFLQE